MKLHTFRMNDEATKTTYKSFPADACQVLANSWADALRGSLQHQSEWEVAEGGSWNWTNDGVTIRNDGVEWAGLAWQLCGPEILGRLRNFLAETTVRGKAEAAGLSFGPFKDFLVPVNNNTGPRRIQVEVDGEGGTWGLRADGRLIVRQWWDSGVNEAHDLLGGVLTLKARRAEEVTFSDLAVYRFTSTCRLSIVVTCYRYVQRLRVVLRNWCNQRLPSGAWEILVVNPDSPDGTAEHVAAVARSYSHIRVREITVPAALATNKGAMINRALDLARGDWIWLTDADCLFSPDAAAMVLQRVEGRCGCLFYGCRRHLSAAQTDSLLSGRLDPLDDFQALAAANQSRPLDQTPWGYTQIFHRSALDRMRYREDVNHFAHSDDAFVAAWRRGGMAAELLDGLVCLHLNHPFAWQGTRAFL
jgi:hypothetical protein